MILQGKDIEKFGLRNITHLTVVALRLLSSTVIHNAFKLRTYTLVIYNTFQLML